MLIDEKPIKHPLKTAIVLITGLILILSIAKSFYFTTRYGGTDLRCRIVGSRLLDTKESSYFYRWHNGDDERLLNPNDRGYGKVNGVTVTPALLVLNWPLALLSYRTIRISWTILQYLLLGLSIGMLYRIHRRDGKAILPLLFVIIGFAFSNTWFFNIERGQTYIVYTFIFSLVYFLYTRKGRYAHLWSGIVAGLSVWIRLLLLCISIPFMVTGDRKWLTGNLIGLVIGAALLFVPWKQTWKDYFVAMPYYAVAVNPEPGPNRETPMTIPAIVEGTSNITQFRSDFYTGGFDTLQQYAQKAGLDATAGELATCFIIVACGFSCLFWRQATPFRQKGRSQPDASTLFLFAFLLYMLSELFIVGPRYGYNLIQWCFVVFLLAAKWQDNLVKPLVFATGLLLTNGLPFTFPYMYESGELILFILLFTTVFRRDALSQ
jgi:glycosyl transferase family 87